MLSEAGFQLTPDMIVQGIIGLILLGWGIKGALDARRSTITAVKPNPMVTAVTMAWDSDQRERLLQILERIAAASEAQARSQGSMADQRQLEMNDRIDELLQALKRTEKPYASRTRSSGT